MGSLIVLFKAMVIQVSWNFRIKLAKIYYCPLKSGPVFTSKSRSCWRVSQDSSWSIQGNQTRTRCSSWNSSWFNSSSSHALDHSARRLHHQPLPHSSRWQDIIRAGVQQGSLRSCGSFRGKSSGPCSSHPSLPKASFEGSASEALPIVVGKLCHHWNAHRGSRRSDFPNPNSNNSRLSSSAKSLFLLMIRTSLSRPQEDRIALQELLRSFIMQQKSKMQDKDFKPLDQRIEVAVEHTGSSLTASPAEGANQQLSSLPASSRSTAASQPSNVPQPPGLQMPPGLQVQHPHQPQQQTQQSDQRPTQVRRRLRTKPKPQDSPEIAVLQDIKENHLPITQDQINADHQEAQSEEELLQGLILQEWYQGGLQGYSADQLKEAITKEIKQIGYPLWSGCLWSCSS